MAKKLYILLFILSFFISVKSVTAQTTPELPRCTYDEMQRVLTPLKYILNYPEDPTLTEEQEISRCLNVVSGGLKDTCFKQSGSTCTERVSCSPSGNQLEGLTDLCQTAIRDKKWDITLVPKEDEKTGVANNFTASTDATECDNGTIRASIQPVIDAHPNGFSDFDKCISTVKTSIRCTPSNELNTLLQNVCSQAVSNKVWNLGLLPAPAGAADGPDCGEVGKQCCQGNLRLSTNVNVNDPGLCFFGVCLNGLLNNIGNIFTDAVAGGNMDGNNISDLKMAGFCKPFNENGKVTDTLPQIDPETSQCMCQKVNGEVKTFELCRRYVGPAIQQSPSLSTSKEYAQCIACFQGCDPSDPQCAAGNAKGDKGGVWTGIGCVYASNPTDFMQKNVMPLAISFSGLAAVLCIAYAGVSIQLSRGNPEKVKNSQQMLTSCITGLMMVIFSVLILHIIGVDLLKLPGFK